MKKSKHNVAGFLPDLALDSAGFAHGLNLLLLAIAKTNPSVGTLLDEFTAIHAEYLAEIQALARKSDDYLDVLERFSESAKLIYKRLSALDAEQSAAMRSAEAHPGSSARIH